MITLSASGGSVTFVFSDNSGYLQNGTIAVPVNSLSMIIDESNMVTFRKPNNDVFISALLSEFGMTKEEMIAWYKANMVGSTGGGTDTGTVQTMIDESISGKADISAATVTNTESGSTSGTGAQNTYTFNYSDGVYYFSAATNSREDMLSFSQIKYKSSADGVEKTISSTGDTDDYTYTTVNNTRTITFKGNNYLTNINVFGDGTGYRYIYYYNSSAPVAVSTVIEDVIYPKFDSLDAAISGKVDAASAVTNVRILTVSQQNSLQIEQRINNDYQFVGNVYKIGSGLTWDYSTKEIEVDNSTVALKTDLSGKLDVSAYTPVTIDSAITSNSTNAVQSSAIYDKVTITVEEIATSTGSSSDRMVSNEYNYSDGVFSYSADNFSIEEQGLYPWLQYNDGESTKMLMFSAGTVDTDDYSYTLSGNSLYVEFKGANRILDMHFVVVNGQTMTYSYSYVGGQSIQWLKDYVSALEARVKILEQNNT